MASTHLKNYADVVMAGPCSGKPGTKRQPLGPLRKVKHLVGRSPSRCVKVILGFTSLSGGVGREGFCSQLSSVQGPPGWLFDIGDEIFLPNYLGIIS